MADGKDDDRAIEEESVSLPVQLIVCFKSVQSVDYSTSFEIAKVCRRVREMRADDTSAHVSLVFTELNPIVLRTLQRAGCFSSTSSHVLVENNSDITADDDEVDGGGGVRYIPTFMQSLHSCENVLLRAATHAHLIAPVPKVFRERLLDDDEGDCERFLRHTLASSNVRDVKALRKYLRPLDFQRGDKIWEHGDKAQSMYFVRRGELSVTSSDRRDVVEILHPGSTFGFLFAMSVPIERRVTDVTVLCDQTRLLELDHRAMTIMRTREPELLIGLFGFVLARCGLEYRYQISSMGM